MLTRFGLCFLLLACARSEPVPQSSYFAADDGALQRKLVAVFGHYRMDSWVGIDASAPSDYAQTIHFRWPFDGGSRFHVRVRGKRILGPHWPVCSIEIGPDVARRPFPVERIYKLFDDADLARRVEAAVGPLDLRRPYEIDLMVDGFHIWFRQFPGPGEATIHIVIDGCGRVAPRHGPWHTLFDTHRELTFAAPPEE